MRTNTCSTQGIRFRLKIVVSRVRIPPSPSHSNAVRGSPKGEPQSYWATDWATRRRGSPDPRRLKPRAHGPQPLRGRALCALDCRSPGPGLAGRFGAGPNHRDTDDQDRPHGALSLLVNEQQRYDRTDRLDRHADSPPSPRRHPGSATGTGRERVERKS